MVFVRKSDKVVTPERGVLHGVTRATVLELLDAEPGTVGCEPVPIADVETADEVFITSTTGGVMPVTRISGKPVGNGRPGELTARLNDAYWKLHTDPAYTSPVDYGK